MSKPQYVIYDGRRYIRLSELRRLHDQTTRRLGWAAVFVWVWVVLSMFYPVLVRWLSPGAELFVAGSAFLLPLAWLVNWWERP